MCINKRFCLLIAVIVFLTGCANQTTEKQKEKTEISKGNILEDIPLEATTSGETNSEATYSIEVITYSFKNINVEYPKIIGIKNKEREEKINKIIRDYILLEIIDTNDTARQNELTMKLELHIAYQSQELLSFFYVGSPFLEGARPFDFFGSMTLDMVNIKEQKLSDFLDIDESLVERIKSSTDVRNQAVDNGMDKKFLLDEIQNKDDEIMIKGLTEGWCGFVIEPDTIVIEVPVMYASGVYALVRLPGRIVDNRFIID